MRNRHGCRLSTCSAPPVQNAGWGGVLHVANANGAIGKSLDQAKERFIRAKIEAFRKGLAPHLKTLPGPVTEDLDINLNAVQSIIRIARNEAGPSAARPPSRDQCYVNLQIFVHYADHRPAM